MASCHFLADNYSTVLGACFEGPDGEEQCIHQMGGGLQVGGGRVGPGKGCVEMGKGCVEMQG